MAVLPLENLLVKVVTSSLTFTAYVLLNNTSQFEFNECREGSLDMHLRQQKNLFCRQPGKWYLKSRKNQMLFSKCILYLHPRGYSRKIASGGEAWKFPNWKPPISQVVRVKKLLSLFYWFGFKKQAHTSQKGLFSNCGPLIFSSEGNCQTFGGEVSNPSVRSCRSITNFGEHQKYKIRLIGKQMKIEICKN